MKIIKRVKKLSFRDQLWNYPEKLLLFYRETKPLSYILFSLLISVISFLTLIQGNVLASFKQAEDTIYVEGVVGTITTLNPIYLNQNQVDRDLYELIYDKLIYFDKNGTPQPGIIQEWAVDPDLKHYVFRIADDRYWHDGTKITTDDIIFTVKKAQSLLQTNAPETIGSQLSNAVFTKLDESRFSVDIDESSAVLLEALSIYPLPQHVLSEVKDSNYYQYGSLVPPVGSGPYKVVSVRPTVVKLEAFNDYPTQPKVKNFEYRVYPDLESLTVAFKNNQLDAISNLEGRELGFIKEYPQYSLNAALLKHRRKVIFMNVAKESLKDFRLRGAISMLIDKEELLNRNVIDGNPVFSSISSDSWAYDEKVDYYPYNPKQATDFLTDLGYKQEAEKWVDSSGKQLSFTLTYLENDLNEGVGRYLREKLAKGGIELKLKPVQYIELTQEVMATRNFDMLLFEIETSIDPDQYNLWHSSKANYPDLNISGYNYRRVDVILEDARTQKSRTTRLEQYQQFQKYIAVDCPVIFLYEPTFNIVTKENVKGVDLSNINFPSDRFRTVYNYSLNK
ncbi:MAG: peptide-binding protein [Candidatus Dojkabacteria bacterium]